jgi:ribosomal protein L11 methyltransferase
VVRLALRVDRAAAEPVLAQLLMVMPAGCEERDIDERTVEFAVYGAAGELPTLPQLQARIGDALVQVSTSEVGEDWAERWRDFHRPVLIRAPAHQRALRSHPGLRERAILVRAPWAASPACPPGTVEIVIDPGQAFGTGAHPSTQLALELLLIADGCTQPGAVLDIGTGSGVLAIAARALGHAPVLAIDSDRTALDSAAANAARSGVAIELQRCDIRRERCPLPRGGRGPLLVLANLLRPLLLELAERIELERALLILSGLLDHELDEVAERFHARLHTRELARAGAEGWGALLLELP